MKKAWLVLEDGETFEGRSFGGEGEVFGEAVFNTSMTGYQEILTDPSYAGQLVTLTYPLIGNYGVNPEDVESSRPRARALIIRRLCRNPNNFRATTGLDEYLAQNGVVGIEGVDTRRLTLHIREQGAMRAGITTRDDNPKSFAEKVQAAPRLVDENLVEEVTASEAFEWDPSGEKSINWPAREFSREFETPYHVAVVDFGVKTNILRLLRTYFRKVTVHPCGVGAEELLAGDPDGIFLSNGPGDPARVVAGVRMIRKILGKKPLFGICLGHQLLALALGARTYKMKFGHRGANQPVRASHKKNIEITSQNHGFAVDEKTLTASETPVEATHVNLNDFTNEGIRVPGLNAFSVQYHPESSPGPHDSRYLFEDFAAMIRSRRGD